MTQEKDYLDLADRVEALTRREANILDRLAEGRKLGCADREDDRARQKLRRGGFIAYCGKPLRWQISATGLQLRSLAHASRVGDRRGGDHG